MFKKFKDHDKQLVEFEFKSGSKQAITFTNLNYYESVQNLAPYNDDNTVRFGLKGDTFLPRYFNETPDFDVYASAAASYGSLKTVFDSINGRKVHQVYGIADHQARFFTAFNKDERTQVPMVLIAPNKNSKLYNLPGSSFTIEIKYYPEKPGGPNDGICNLTLTGSAKLSASFIDSDLISFHSISQDNKVLHSNYGARDQDEATASFHYRFAGDHDKIARPRGGTSFQRSHPRFYGHPKPVLEVFGMSSSYDGFTDNFPASLSRNDPGDGIRPAAWRRPGVMSASVGYHLSCSNWNYSYISWRTGSYGPYTASLKFDQYGVENGFIGGVVNYTKDEKGNEHFATMSVADPGQINDNLTGSLWTNVTRSQNFRKLGNNLGLIQLGGKYQPGKITYQANIFPIVAESEHDVHRGTAGGLQEGISGSNPYYGGIKEVRIWDSALDHNTLATWSLREIDDTHPQLNHLVGYWKFDIENAQSRLQDYGRGSATPISKPNSFRWHLPTSSFVYKRIGMTTEDAYFIFQPQSGSGYIPNNDSSSFTAMDKVSPFPGFSVPGERFHNLKYTNDGVPLEITRTATVPQADEVISRNPYYDTTIWNPFVIASADRKLGGSGIITGSAKFRFDLTRVIGAPVVGSGGTGVHSFGHAEFVSADTMPSVDRDGSNKVIRPSMYTLPRGYSSDGTSSYNIFWTDNGSGSIYPPTWPGDDNRPCGAVSYANGLMVLRDETYNGLHNLYVGDASMFDYPKGTLDIPSPGGKRTRSEQAATGSGFYNTFAEYSGSLKVTRLQLNCRANFNEFNASTNKTFAKAYKNVTSSLENTGSVTYISGIGIYDDENNLIAVGKLSIPIRKEAGQAITTKLRLDL